MTRFERERCRLDVYCSEGRSGFATLSRLHGGGLWGGDRKIDPYLTDLFPLPKQEGIALVSIDSHLEIDAGILTI